MTGVSKTTLNVSLSLYKQLANQDPERNLFFSPFSITTALSMTLAGARNTTASQMKSVLHITDDNIHKEFSDVLNTLKGCSSDVTLHIANRLYSEKTFPPLSEYVSLLEKLYQATLKQANFIQKTDEERLAINSWVEETTRQKIKDLLPFGSVRPDTVLILVNAIYFKGLWASQFKPKATRKGTFYESETVTKEVDMMHQKGTFGVSYSESLNVTALEIPYRGNKTSMVIILPNEASGFKSLEQNLTPENLSELLNNFTEESDVSLSLPKFKLEESFELSDTLKVMGMSDLFTRNADLSGIFPSKDVCVSNVIHKAFVEVSEEGTEAAAATAVLMVRCCMVGLTFVVDHPFLFLIRSKNPDSILFMGSVKHF